MEDVAGDEDGVVVVSLGIAVDLGGVDVAFARGDPEVRLDAGLSVELPEVEGSLGGGDVPLAFPPSVSTVTLISTELDLLLEFERSSTTLSSLSPFLSPVHDVDPLLLLPFLVVEADDRDRTGPVSAPIWLHVFASIASGLDLESSWKWDMEDSYRSSE